MPSASPNSMWRKNKPIPRLTQSHALRVFHLFQNPDIFIFHKILVDDGIKLSQTPNFYSWIMKISMAHSQAKIVF